MNPAANADAPVTPPALVLLRRKAALVGEGHYLKDRVTPENALLCLGIVADAPEVEFSYVMAHVCCDLPAILARRDFRLVCHNVELIERAMRWIVREFSALALEQQRGGELAGPQPAARPAPGPGP